MASAESLQLETNRLRLHEAQAGDVEDLHSIFASNPGFLMLRRDIAEAEGGYDVPSVQRYWEQATLDADRHLLVGSLKATAEPACLVDFVEWSPGDGLPWIGLVVIHGSHQRRGLGTEAIHMVAAFLASRGHAAVRMAVMGGSEGAEEFARSLGFERYDDASAEDRDVTLMQLALPPPG